MFSRPHNIIFVQTNLLTEHNQTQSRGLCLIKFGCRTQSISSARFLQLSLTTGSPSSLVTVNMTLRKGVVIRVCMGNTSILRNSSK